MCFKHSLKVIFVIIKKEEIYETLDDRDDLRKWFVKPLDSLLSQWTTYITLDKLMIKISYVQFFYDKINKLNILFII